MRLMHQTSCSNTIQNGPVCGCCVFFCSNVFGFVCGQGCLYGLVYAEPVVVLFAGMSNLLHSWSPPFPPLPHSLLSTHTGAEVDRIKKNYLESQSRRTTQLRGLSDELQGVQKIMFENIDTVLQRGELITGEHFSNNLVPVPE